MEKYIYQKPGGGIPGLPHEIEKEVGDAWIAEYEEEAGKEDGSYLEGMPGYILKAALKNKSYKLVGEKKEKAPKESKKLKE